MTGAPYIRTSATSAAASGAIKPHLANLERHVADWFAKHGPRSTEEAIDALRMDGNTVRPRIVELVKKGVLIPAGIGKTKKNRTCVLYDFNRLPANQTSLL